VYVIDILYNKFLDTALPFISMAKTVTTTGAALAFAERHHRHWLSRWPPVAC